MSTQETMLWQSGETSAPLPPMVDPQDMSDTSQPFIKQYRKLGPVFRVPRPGQPLTVLVGPEANTFVARYGDEFFVSREFWEDFGKALSGEQGSGISHERDGEANRLRRAKSSRRYSRARVLDQLPRMVEIVREYTQAWPQEQSIAILPAMQRIVAEQLGQLLVHHEVGDYLQDFITYLDTSIENAMITKRPEAFSDPAFPRAKERTYELGRIILAEHRAEPASSRKPDLLDDVLADAAKHPEKYTEEKLERASLGPFLAGIDTVAYTSSFMIYALLKNQDVLKRVLAEVDDAFAQGPLTWEKLKSMQAIHGAAMETLRIYTVAGGQMLRVAKPLTFAGYRLEPGDVVFVATTVSHFLPELFPEPDTFDIDRYHAPRDEHRQPGAYAPFGLGDHTCLGAGIAEIQLMVNIATILHMYRLAIDPPDYQLAIEHDSMPRSVKQFRIKGTALPLG